MPFLPLLLGAGLLLLLGSKSKSAAPPKLPAPAPRLVPSASNLSAPKSAPKTLVRIGPATILKRGPTTAVAKKKAAASTAQSLTPSMSLNPSQGASTSLTPALSTDIPHDSAPSATKSATTSRSLPGYNPTSARKGAASLSNNLKRTGKAGYDRRMMRQWQTQAGLTADGLYGPATRGALIYFGVKDPPAAFSGSGTATYKPPV